MLPEKISVQEIDTYLTIPLNERTHALVSIRCVMLKYFALPVKVCECQFHILTSLSHVFLSFRIDMVCQLGRQQFFQSI